MQIRNPRGSTGESPTVEPERSVGSEERVELVPCIGHGSQHMVIEGEVENNIVKLLIDTGASIYIIRVGVSSAEIEPSEFKVRGVTGDELMIIGSQKVTTHLGNDVFDLKFSVCEITPLPYDIVLGLDNLELVSAKIN